MLQAEKLVQIRYMYIYTLIRNSKVNALVLYPGIKDLMLLDYRSMLQLVNMDRGQLRELIWKEIMEYHQPRTPTQGILGYLRPVPQAHETDVNNATSSVKDITPSVGLQRQIKSK